MEASTCTVGLLLLDNYVARYTLRRPSRIMNNLLPVGEFNPLVRHDQSARSTNGV